MIGVKDTATIGNGRPDMLTTSRHPPIGGFADRTNVRRNKPGQVASSTVLATFRAPQMASQSMEALERVTAAGTVCQLGPVHKLTRRVCSKHLALALPWPHSPAVVYSLTNMFDLSCLGSTNKRASRYFVTNRRKHSTPCWSTISPITPYALSRSYKLSRSSSNCNNQGCATENTK